MTLTMKRGDLEPEMIITVEDMTGNADLAQVTAWRVIGRLNGTVIIDSPPTTVEVDAVNSSVAVLTRAWVAGDTDIAGVIQVEVEAAWPGGRPQTFPSGSYGRVIILPDLA